MRNTLRKDLATLEKLVGNTPVVELPHEDVRLYAKLEYFNLSGSLKDRPAFEILRAAIERGEVGVGSTIIESSSGNFASALATLCKRIGLDFIPVIDPNINGAYESFLRLMTDDVCKVTTPDQHGGYQSIRINKVRELLKTISGSYWTNQYENPDCLSAHYRTTGCEILTQVPDVDYVFVGVSSGGTLAGVSNYLKEHNPRVQVIAVDAVGSLIFGGPACKRYIPGIGSTVRSALVEQSLYDDVVMVSEADTVVGCRDLMARHGVFAGGSSGTAYAAINRYFAGKPATRRKPKALFLCADRGTPYMETIYNDAWVDRHFGALVSFSDEIAAVGIG